MDGQDEWGGFNTQTPSERRGALKRILTSKVSFTIAGVLIAGASLIALVSSCANRIQSAVSTAPVIGLFFKDATPSPLDNKPGIFASGAEKNAYEKFQAQQTLHEALTQACLLNTQDPTTEEIWQQRLAKAAAIFGVEYATDNTSPQCDDESSPAVLAAAGLLTPEIAMDIASQKGGLDVLADLYYPGYTRESFSGEEKPKYTFTTPDGVTFSFHSPAGIYTNMGENRTVNMGPVTPPTIQFNDNGDGIESIKFVAADGNTYTIDGAHLLDTVIPADFVAPAETPSAPSTTLNEAIEITVTPPAITTPDSNAPPVPITGSDLKSWSAITTPIATTGTPPSPASDGSSSPFGPGSLPPGGIGGNGP